MAASTTKVITTVDLTTSPALPKIASGKVRDLYDLSPESLLFVTTDRISAYDVIMSNGIPDKGAVLTALSAHWFQNVLPARIPGLKTHFISSSLPADLAGRLNDEDRATLRGRCMAVRKLRVFPVEAIVRGYITGSAWKEYVRTGTVHGIQLPAGLRECEAIPGGPIYTPSTKAEQGQHDENISPAEAARIIGNPAHAARVEELALQVFRAASTFAEERGLMLADTKFEFGLDEATGEVVLVDEVLTPDSSRVWDRETYEVGRDQDSFDKQFLRNWLTREGLKGKPGVEVPEDIAKATGDRYKEVFRRLTGKTLEEALAEA